MDSFTEYLDNNIPFHIIYLDFKKAFGNVPHERLIAKLNMNNRKHLIMDKTISCRQDPKSKTRKGVLRNRRGNKWNITVKHPGTSALHAPKFTTKAVTIN